MGGILSCGPDVVVKLSEVGYKLVEERTRYAEPSSKHTWPMCIFLSQVVINQIRNTSIDFTGSLNSTTPGTFSSSRFHCRFDMLTFSCGCESVSPLHREVLCNSSNLLFISISHSSSSTWFVPILSRVSAGNVSMHRLPTSKKNCYPYPDLGWALGLYCHLEVHMWLTKYRWCSVCSF